MVDGASTMTLFPYLLNVMGSGGWCQYYDIVSIPAECDGWVVVDGASAMTLFPYLLNVMGSGGWCQYYDIVSIPAECDG